MENPAMNRERKVLNPEQKKAVEFGDGPLLIIAGAGTGKTTVITERIKYLIQSGKCTPHEILALTFTEKASREMEERVDRAMPYGVTNMWISTFHAFCDRILKNESLSIGLDPNFKLMTEAETVQFFHDHLFEFDLSHYRPLGNPTKFLSGMIQHFSRLKDEDITPSEYAQWVLKRKTGLTADADAAAREQVALWEELSGAYRKYEELKTKHSVADYGDLIANTLRIFRSRPSVLQEYRDKFKYVLIDEFQDTNFAQNEMAVLLAGERKNITVVGDDDQAIYRWRGAAISNIIQFRHRFPGAQAIVLTKNYRSAKEILDRSYDMIRHNDPDRLEVAENISKKLECMRRANGKPVAVLYRERVEDEAEATAKEILALTREQKGKAGREYRDIAILVRANAHAEPFTRAFARHGIPFQFLGPGQLFKQAEVKDLVAYLKSLYDVDDTVAMYRVLSQDHIGIDPRDVASLVSYSKRYGISLFRAAEAAVPGLNGTDNEGMPTPFLSDDGVRKISAFVSMFRRHLALIRRESAGQILYYYLQDSGLLQALTAFKTVKDERAADNIAKFFNKLKTYEADHEDASVYAVVDWLDLSINLGESPMASNSDWTEFNAVNILTIHSSKGLEFPVVFIVNLVGQRFPTTEKHEQIPIPDGIIKEVLPEGDYHLQEERRLFYVAMTRARDLLFFTGAKYYGEGKREKKLSPFIAEAIGEDALRAYTAQTTGKEEQLFLLDWSKEAMPEATRDSGPRQPVTYLSYSQVETFKRCPLQFKYRYVLKIPVPPSAALAFGDAMHKTLKSFYEQVKSGANPTEDVLLNLYRASWSSLGYRDRKYEALMRDHGTDLLREYYKYGYDPKVEVLSVEQSFKIRITPSLVLGGKIDRVDRLPDGKLEIIDYKTGTAPKSRDVRSDAQLTVYALAATDKSTYGADAGNVTVSLYFLEGQEKVMASRSGDQLEAQRADIRKTAEDISSSDFKPVPGMHCDFCEFRLICEAWK